MSKVNATKATLATVNASDAKQQLAGAVQSAAKSAVAAAALAASYKAGNRTFGYDLKNETQRVALETYTVSRLAFENELRAGEGGNGRGGAKLSAGRSGQKVMGSRSSR